MYPVLHLKDPTERESEQASREIQTPPRYPSFPQTVRPTTTITNAECKQFQENTIRLCSCDWKRQEVGGKREREKERGAESGHKKNAELEK